jgi:purine-nucleoside phosphorylase
MASEITHVFAMLGTRRVIQTGVCGGLTATQRAGDLVLASAAGCGEGAVACYLPGTETVNASTDLLERAHTRAGNDGVHVGPVWTTAALLAEGMDDLRRWRDEGYIAVDMETATTFGVAAWAGKECVSVLSIFDNPLDGAHLGLEEADKASLRDRGEQRALEIVLALATHR